MVLNVFTFKTLQAWNRIPKVYSISVQSRFRLFSTFLITANKALCNIWSQYYASTKGLLIKVARCNQGG